jgi:hypothetical protein
MLYALHGIQSSDPNICLRCKELSFAKHIYRKHECRCDSVGVSVSSGGCDGRGYVSTLAKRWKSTNKCEEKLVQRIFYNSNTCGLYYKTITIIIMTIVSDAPNCGITYDRNSSFIILATVITIVNYDRKTFIVQATGKLSKVSILRNIRKSLFSHYPSEFSMRFYNAF